MQDSTQPTPTVAGDAPGNDTEPNLRLANPTAPSQHENDPEGEVSAPEDASAESVHHSEVPESQDSAPSTQPSSQPVEALSLLGKWLVGAGILFWLGIYLGGTTVDSAPFRKAISEEGLIATIGTEKAADVTAFDGPMQTAVVVSFFFYTPTNLALLTLLAGLLGTLGRKASLYSNKNAAKDADPSNPKLSALLRSFLVYLVFVSGVLVFSEAPFAAPSPTSYLRLAGLMSLMSFVANYRPSFFARILEGALSYLDTKGGSKEDSA